MCERKGKKREDGVAGKDHCWLLQRTDFISGSIKNFVKLNKSSLAVNYKHKSTFFLSSKHCIWTWKMFDKSPAIA